MNQNEENFWHKARAASSLYQGSRYRLGSIILFFMIF